MNQVYALCTGGKTTPRSQFLFRDPSQAPLQMAFYFWLVIAGGEPVAVDCSIGPDEGRRRSVEGYRDRRELLAACGVKPEDVRRVFMTHLHYDHWEGHDLFRNATYFVQEKEIAFWKGPGLAYPMFANSASASALARVDPLMAEGRIKVVDGDWSPGPGLRAHLLPGHTPGLQALEVDCGKRRVLIASDTFHFYDDLAQRKPVQVTVSMLDAARSMDRVAAFSSGEDAVALPGHDPQVMQRFPNVAPGVARVA